MSFSTTYTLHDLKNCTEQWYDAYVATTECKENDTQLKAFEKLNADLTRVAECIGKKYQGTQDFEQLSVLMVIYGLICDISYDVSRRRDLSSSDVEKMKAAVEKLTDVLGYDECRKHYQKIVSSWVVGNDLQTFILLGSIQDKVRLYNSYSESNESDLNVTKILKEIEIKLYNIFDEHVFSKIAAAKEKISNKQSRLERYILREGITSLVNLAVHYIVFFRHISKTESVRPELHRLMYLVLQKHLEFVRACQEKSTPDNEIKLLPTQLTLRHPLNRVFIQDIDAYQARFSALKKGYLEHFTILQEQRVEGDDCISSFAYPLCDEAVILNEYVQRKTILPQEAAIWAAELKNLILHFTSLVTYWGFPIFNRHLILEQCDQGLKQIESIIETPPKLSLKARVVYFFSHEKAQRERARKALGEVMTEINKYNDQQKTSGSSYPTLTCNIVPKTKPDQAIVNHQQTYQQSDESKSEAKPSSLGKKKKSGVKPEGIDLPLLGEGQHGSTNDLNGKKTKSYGTL